MWPVFAQPDVVRVGGVTPWLQIADMVVEHDLKLAPHHGDMMQAQIHMCIGHCGGFMLEYIPWTLECFEEPARVDDGVYLTPQQPGAGTTFRADALAKYNVIT